MKRSFLKTSSISERQKQYCPWNPCQVPVVLLCLSRPKVVVGQQAWPTPHQQCSLSTGGEHERWPPIPEKATDGQKDSSERASQYLRYAEETVTWRMSVSYSSICLLVGLLPEIEGLAHILACQHRKMIDVPNDDFLIDTCAFLL